jgi:signal transduction histidine kinase
MVENELKLEDISVELNLDVSRPQVVAHPVKLSQVVFNLLTNAAESIAAKRELNPRAPCESRIELSTCVRNHRVEIIVADTGIGIPAHLIHRVTEPFFSRKSSNQANGLGLTISEQILKDFGGEIEIESEEGHGARFTASIPIHPKALVKERADHG